jgi:hypothetical protein
MKQAIGAHGYFECSALTGDGIQELFTNAATSVLYERLQPQVTAAGSVSSVSHHHHNHHARGDSKCVVM